MAAVAAASGTDAMDVDAQPPAAAAAAAASTTKPSAKPATKATPKKGKGKGRASRASTAAAAAAAAAAEAAAEAAKADDGDSDVDMSGAADAADDGQQKQREQEQSQEQEEQKRQQEGNGATASVADKPEELDMVGLLDCIPREPVYITWPHVPLTTPTLPPPAKSKGLKGLKKLGKGGAGDDASASVSLTSGSGAGAVAGPESGSGLPPLLRGMACLLRSLAVAEWLAGALTLLTRWAHSRSAQSAGGQQAAARWGPILVSGEGREIMERLTKLHRYVLLEVRTFLYWFCIVKGAGGGVGRIGKG